MFQIRLHFYAANLKSISNWSYQIQQCIIRHPRFFTVSTKAEISSTLHVMNRRVPSAVCVKDMRTARAVIANLSPDERIRLQNALMDSGHSCTQINLRNTLNVQLSREQSKQLFIVNTLPFIGFGFLDNFLMIVAAEYIEHSLGMVLAVSTMAAAGLGHIVADLAGIGLTHYVEYIVSKLGVKRPVLTAEQLQSSMARKVINLSRTFGLVVGCLIGMFPLLFYKDPKSS